MFAQRVTTGIFPYDMAKDTRIAFRTSNDRKERLQKVAELVGLSETTLAEACIEALIHYIEEHGEIRLPLSVVPTAELKKGLPKGDRLSSSTAPSLNPPPPDRLILNEEPTRGMRQAKYSPTRRGSMRTQPKPENLG